MIGVDQSATRLPTIAVKAAPMMIPTAMSRDVTLGDEVFEFF
jgi:hypothetical protein